MPKRNKNFLITLILIILFWTTLLFMIFFTEPEMTKDILIRNSYLVFFIHLFFALFLTTSVIFSNSITGLLITLGIISFLILRMHKLGNFLNAFLIIFIVFILNRYFTSTERKTQRGFTSKGRKASKDFTNKN